MSHTPGPWTTRELTCEDHRGMGWIEADGRDISPYGDSALWMEQNRANGKLMAAAPDLLEALKELLSAELTQMPPYEAGKDAQDAWADRRAAARNNASAVIAKATQVRA